MGKFLEGYEIGINRSKNKEQKDYKDLVKELISSSSYGECVEWFNGFYKGMLDLELYNLKNAFQQMTDKKIDLKEE